MAIDPTPQGIFQAHMAEQHPWPTDPAPGAMAYVGVCSDCYGVTWVCATDHLAEHIPMLIASVQRGNDLHRVPATDLYKSGWQFCHCWHREAVPHAC